MLPKIPGELTKYRRERFRDRTSGGTKLYQIAMMDGTPYRRLIALNGKPRSQGQEAQAMKHQQRAEAQRQAESANAAQTDRLAFLNPQMY